MTTTTSNITAAEWLDIRDAVAKTIKSTTTSQFTTCVSIAERLLRNGFIDIEAVRESLRPTPEVGAD